MPWPPTEASTHHHSALAASTLTVCRSAIWAQDPVQAAACTENLWVIRQFADRTAYSLESIVDLRSCRNALLIDRVLLRACCSLSPVVHLLKPALADCHYTLEGVNLGGAGLQGASDTVCSALNARMLQKLPP